MDTLFPIARQYPKGFSYVHDFINRTEELLLLKEISQIELHTFLFQGYQAKRRVASFGYDYSFDKRSISKGKEIPIVFGWLIDKVADYTGIRADKFAELLITEYPAGAVINWHRDAPPFDVIVGISLGADCNFRLKPHDKEKQTRGSIISIPVQRRSLYVLRDEVRTDWQHSTQPLKAVRYSITLRTLRSA
jgi:alkylated DNA repair dioxygenase AlkB